MSAPAYRCALLTAGSNARRGGWRAARGAGLIALASIERDRVVPRTAFYEHALCDIEDDAAALVGHEVLDLPLNRGGIAAHLEAVVAVAELLTTRRAGAQSLGWRSLLAEEEVRPPAAAGRPEAA